MQSDEQDNKRAVVLTGIDLSQRSEDVLHAAAKWAAMTGADLHLVHVIPGDMVGSGRGEAALRLSNTTDDVRAKLAELANSVPASVKRIVLHVRIGNADLEIAQLASDVSADLLVVGTHGHGTLERLILGSVAESLTRHAPCPVLVCRPKAVRRWEKILPPCPDCVAVQRSTERKTLWCERHSQHHPRAHTYSEVPGSFGVGSMTFR